MPSPTTALLDALAGGAVRVIDLTQPLSERTPVIRLPPPFANTPPLSRRPLSRYDDRGPAWAWDVLDLGEHTGTHIDAPIHWITGREGEDVGSIPAERLVGPAVVIDRTAEVGEDPGYLLTVADLEAFEAEHGPMPTGAWVLFRTGWGARAEDAEAFLNVGPEGPVSPGPDAEAAAWLATERDIVGFGVETVGIDAGAAGGFDPPFPVHHHLLGNGRYGLTQLANLDQLPVTGALIVVAPLRLVGGTGSPVRALALVGESSSEVLDTPALNRALLDRQLLLRRVAMPVADAVEHLLGLQAQSHTPPYYGLWSRLEGFDPHELGRGITERAFVRMTLMRGTVHLVTVRDALVLRPLTQLVVERSHNGAFGRRMGGAEPAAIAAAVREELADGPLGARELGRRLVARGIGDDAEALGNATRVHLPLVQVPPRGVWGAGGQAKYATLEAWTGRELDPAPSIDAIVLRYLRAFGPASVMDAQNWSGITRLRAVFERLRPQLVEFRDDRGVPLFDLPDAPRPDPDVPAPVRFLGEYDNVLLGHADRRRMIPPGYPWDAMLAPGRWIDNLLVDGVLRASWWLERDGRRHATLAIRPATALSATERAAVGDEAERMADFAVPDAAVRDVRFEPAVA